MHDRDVWSLLVQQDAEHRTQAPRWRHLRHEKSALSLQGTVPQPVTNPAAGEGASDMILFRSTTKPRKAQTSEKALEEMLHIMRDNKPPLKPDTEDHQEPARRCRGEDVEK